MNQIKIRARRGRTALLALAAAGALSAGALALAPQASAIRDRCPGCPYGSMDLAGKTAEPASPADSMWTGTPYMNPFNL